MASLVSTILPGFLVLHYFNVVDAKRLTEQQGPSDFAPPKTRTVAPQPNSNPVETAQSNFTSIAQSNSTSSIDGLSEAVVTDNRLTSDLPTNHPQLPHWAKALPKKRFKNGYCPMPSNFHKYAGSALWRFTFKDEDALKSLRQHYQETVHNVPGFLQNLIVLCLDWKGFTSVSQESQLKAFVNAPNLYNYREFNKGTKSEAGVILYPAPGYNDIATLNAERLTAKHKTGGVTYLMYLIHPEVAKGRNFRGYEDRIFAEKARFAKTENAVLQELSSTCYVNLFQHAHKHRDQEVVRRFLRTTIDHHQVAVLADHSDYDDDFGEQKISEGGKVPLIDRWPEQVTCQKLVEQSGGIKYYASILDLEADDLEMLKSMKTWALEHLKLQHKFKEGEDTVYFYFHFPYLPSTTTIHLHIRLNQGVLPVEDAKSMPLDSIIEWFEQGNTNIYGLILERQKYSNYSAFGDTPKKSKKKLAFIMDAMKAHGFADGVKAEETTMSLGPYCGEAVEEGKCIEPEECQV